MPKITSSQGDLIRRLREASLEVLAKTVQDPLRQQKIDDLCAAADLCHSFVYGYTSIADPAIDSDDEILNWSWGDVTGDLGAGIWSLSCGFYKAAASNLRNALDLAVATLYRQIRENTDPVSGGWNRFYAEWDRGDRASPNWGEMKPILKRQPSVQTFDYVHGSDVVEELYSFFGRLSGYTHGRAFAVDGRPVRAIDTEEAHSPSFDADQFDHLSTLTLETVCWVCAIWQIVYPQIMATEPLGPITDRVLYEQVFSALPRGREAMDHRPREVS